MSCEIDNDWGKHPECFSAKDRKARKEHTCCECGETIPKDALYRYESGIWEGEPQDYKTCLDCISVRDTFFCGFVFGSVWEDMRVMVYDYGEVSSEKINSLTPKAREKVIALVDEILNYEEEK